MTAVLWIGVVVLWIVAWQLNRIADALVRMDQREHWRYVDGDA